MHTVRWQRSPASTFVSLILDRGRVDSLQAVLFFALLHLFTILFSFSKPLFFLFLRLGLLLVLKFDLDAQHHNDVDDGLAQQNLGLLVPVQSKPLLAAIRFAADIAVTAVESALQAGADTTASLWILLCLLLFLLLGWFNLCAQVAELFQ